MKIHPQSVFRFLFTKSIAALSRSWVKFGRLQAWSFVIVLFGFLAMPLHGQYVYVANSNDSSLGSVSGYSIGSGGALIAAPIVPFQIEVASSVAVDRTSKFVYIGTVSDNLIAGYSIGPGGVLTYVTQYADPNLRFSPTWVTANPERDFIYATSQDMTLRTFSLSSDGQLTPFGSPLATGSFPTCVAVAPKGGAAYVTNWDDNTVSGY
jgi:6-phosphogluconolactonase (cycloisomerase 2 family)